MDEVIHSYSRAEAIEDGVLVDLSAQFADLAKEAGIRFPVAVTQAVFAECIELTPAAKRAGNDIQGRAWDVFWMFRNAIRGAGRTDRIEFQLYVVRKRVKQTLTTLVATCHPGDDMEPVITIGFPNED